MDSLANPQLGAKPVIYTWIIWQMHDQNKQQKGAIWSGRWYDWQAWVGRGSWNENEATTGFHSDKFYGVSRTLWVKLTDRDGGYDEGIAVEQCWRLSRHIAAEILQKQLFFFRQVLVACHLEQLKPERPSVSRALPT